MCSGAQSSRTLSPSLSLCFSSSSSSFFAPLATSHCCYSYFWKSFQPPVFHICSEVGFFFMPNVWFLSANEIFFPFCNFGCSSSFFLESFMKKKLNVINPLQANFKWLALAFRYWSIAADQQNVIRCSGKVEHLFWKMTKKRNAYSSQNKKKE